MHSLSVAVTTCPKASFSYQSVANRVCRIELLLHNSYKTRQSLAKIWLVHVPIRDLVWGNRVASTLSYIKDPPQTPAYSSSIAALHIKYHSNEILYFRGQCGL